jgi:hypothetical protein
LGSKKKTSNFQEEEMPNYFMFVAWALIIFLTRVAYRISLKKFKPDIAATIAGLTGIVAVFVSANVIGALYMGHFKIGDIFRNLIFIVFPWLVQ